MNTTLTNLSYRQNNTHSQHRVELKDSRNHVKVGKMIVPSLSSVINRNGTIQIHDQSSMKK